MTNSIISCNKKEQRCSHIVKNIILLSMLIGITFIGFKNYLLFHITVELFATIIAGTISIIGINTYTNNRNQSLIFLGISYGFVACFDLLHALTYKGMMILPIEGVDIPTQLWIIARYIESISLFIAGFSWKKNINFQKIIGSYFIVSVMLLLSVIGWGIFPSAFIEGVGLTYFKIISEYLICGILAASIILFHKNKTLWNKKTYSYIIASILISILSEFFFTLYIDVYDIFNMIGHILKVISFYLMYRAIIKIAIKMPYEELNKSEQRYRSLIELFPDGVFVIKDDRIILANHRFSQLLGFENSMQLVGKHLKDYATQDWYPIIDKYTRTINPNDKKQIFREEVLSLEGRDIISEVIMAPFQYETHNATLIVLRDVSERKKAQELEKSMEENRKRLEESLEYDRMKTEFYSNLSHEMRTPLNLIFSTVQILELELKNKLIDANDPVINKYILLLRQNFYRMLKLVNNLLDITKMDAGYFKLDLKAHNIINVVEEITLSIVDYTEKKNITLLFDTEVEEKIVYIDPNAIERIMLNLLSNAIKFTDAGADIIVNIYDRQDKILISVKDTGIGIPKDKLKGIFDRFTQVEKTLKRNQQGTGLGLSLVETLVKLHGGKIYVYSELGKGTEFMIELPTQNIDYETCHIEDYGVDEWQSKYVERINIELSDIYPTIQAK